MTKHKFHSIIRNNIQDFHSSVCSHGAYNNITGMSSDIPVILCRTDILFGLFFPAS